MPSRPPRHLESGTIRTYQRIVQATAKVAVQNGLRDLTVAHILEAADVSRRTYYQYFHGKDEALLALYEQICDDLVEAVRRATEAVPDPTRRLFAGLDAYLDFQQYGGELILMLQAEAANPESNLSPLRERTLDQVVAVIDRGVREELGEALDPLIYRLLFLGTEGLVMYLREGGAFTQEHRDRTAKIVKHLFVATLAEAPSMPHAPDPPTADPEDQGQNGP